MTETASGGDWYKAMKDALTEKARHQTEFPKKVLRGSKFCGPWVVLTWASTPSEWQYWGHFTTRAAAVRWCIGKFRSGGCPVRCIRVKTDGTAGKVIDPFAGTSRYGAPVTPAEGAA